MPSINYGFETLLTVLILDERHYKNRFYSFLTMASRFGNSDLFTQRIVDRWNSLQSEVAEAPSLNAFKNRVDLFMPDHILEEPPTSIASDQY